MMNFMLKRGLLCVFAAAAGILQAADGAEDRSFPNGKFDPALSPDGSRIAFAWNGSNGQNSAVYVGPLCFWPVESCKGPTKPPLRLTKSPSAEYGPVWSPGGKQIAFCRKTAKGADVLLVPASGGGEKRLGDSAAIHPRLAWSPDGKSLAVVDTAGIFSISVDNGRKRQLTRPASGSASDDNPAFSPDGKMLAFSRRVNGDAADVYLQPLTNDSAAAGEPRRLNITPEAARGKGAVKGLAWTPDGGGIILASAGAWRVPVAGGASLELAKGEGEVTAVSVSRQGRRVAYAELVPEVEMWRTAGPASKPEEFPPTRLIGSPDDVGSPNVARDGKRIAFGSFMSGTWEVWKCDIDGKNPIQLSFLGDVPTGSPRWSPDGKYVVFDGRGDDGLMNDVYVVSSSGGNARRLTKEPSVDIRPCYSRDQRWIYFTSNRTGTFQIWKIPGEGGNATQVTKNGGFVAFETLDGKYLYYGKGKTENALWRVPVGGGEEVKVLDDVNPSNFAVCNLGVVILNLKAKPRPAIEFYSFATQKRTQLPVLPPNGRAIGSGTSIAVAPDGKWLVYHQEGALASGIRVLEYK